MWRFRDVVTAFRRVIVRWCRRDFAHLASFFLSGLGYGVCLARVVRGSGANFEAMAIPDGAFAAVVGHLEILG